MSGTIGVVVVRNGRLGLGASDVAAVADEVWLLGSGLDEVALAPTNVTRTLKLGAFAPDAWATLLAREVGESSVLFSAEPDGRDLAGRLGERLGVPVYSGCVELRAGRAVTPRYGGATTTVHELADRYVATIQPTSLTATLVPPTCEPTAPSLAATIDVAPLAEIEPDLESVDLADARRIMAGGAGLSDEADFESLAQLAPRMSAAMGATRVITDRGWAPFRRQIGTTGATVSPELYVAFGISGAVQHTSGLGSPEHVISINTDPACPMSQMADVAIVADAHDTLAALVQLVSEAP